MSAIQKAPQPPYPHLTTSVVALSPILPSHHLVRRRPLTRPTLTSPRPSSPSHSSYPHLTSSVVALSLILPSHHLVRRHSTLTIRTPAHSTLTIQTPPLSALLTKC
ncbi:hypothetical protein [Absidia glauca]|uniref:Uncharacterized protein n=1 Tax=Absidia glauca TaxID=4829 RepID=A0A163LQ68_ABSGL|nr:hypothetical protein [Absidia glauca]